MAGSDPVDTHGHSVADAKAQEPALDTAAPPASVKTPEGDQIVRAQTDEEVSAQILNKAGGAYPEADADSDAEDEAEA